MWDFNTCVGKFLSLIQKESNNTIFQTFGNTTISRRTNDLTAASEHNIVSLTSLELNASRGRAAFVSALDKLCDGVHGAAAEVI